jgi:hypothetical protein
VLLIAKDFPDLAPDSCLDAVRLYLKSEQERHVSPQEFFKPASNGGWPLWAEYLDTSAKEEERESA